MTGSDALLSVRDLEVTFPRRGLRAASAPVIRGVSFDIAPGETLSLVGESGSGKTTIGRAILGLAPVTGGSIAFAGETVQTSTSRRRGRTPHGVQVIFQDPYSSLNPAMTIEQILVEPMRSNGVTSGRHRVRELLDAVGLPADAGGRLPREFSGGQRQRIAIARALALEPRLIVCDEPTSALDMTTQARVLDLLAEIQDRTHVSYLFISHDLAVVRRVSDRIAVLLHGEIVELGTAEQVSDAPVHPYTQRLQMATPVADPVVQEHRRADRLRLLAAQRELLEHTGVEGDPWSLEQQSG